MQAFLSGNPRLCAKNLSRFFLVALLLLFTLTGKIMADSTQVKLTISDRGAAFSLIQQTVSTFFEVNINDMKPYHQSSAPDKIIPMLYLAGETRRTPRQIWLNRKGKRWGAIAREMGLPINSHGKYMSGRHRQKYRTPIYIDDYDYEEMMNVRFLHEYYGVAPDVIYLWHYKGLSYEDLFLGFNLSARLRKNPREIFQWRISGRDWRFVAGRYRIPYSLLLKPVRPLRKVVIVKQDYDWNDRDYDNKRSKGRRHRKYD